METQEDSPPITVHQIWLGEEIPLEARTVFTEKLKKACETSGYRYKLWRMKDLLEAFPRDHMSLFWHKVLHNLVYPYFSSFAVDYFKWKVLTLTPETEIGLYLDLDVEVGTNEEGKIDLPYPEAYVTFGLGVDGISPSPSFIHTYGAKAANVVVKEMDGTLRRLDVDSPHFFTDLFSAIKDRDSGPFSFRETWVREKLVSLFESQELLSEIAPADVFSFMGGSENPTFLHHASHFVYGGRKMPGGEKVYLNSLEEKVKEVEKKYEEDMKDVVLLMSTAKEYKESLHRTLGLITAKNIRDVQRGTSLKEVATNPAFDLFFVLGQGDGELEEEERESPDFYYAPVEEGKDNEALRFYHALRWCFDHSRFKFLFICQDDNYIHLSRLLSYVKGKKRNEKKVYGHTDEEGNATQAGILIPVCLVREIALANLDSPKLKEDFGAWLKHALEVLGGEFIEDDKFSYTKGNYPAPTNGRITTHEVNPFDLVLLHTSNEG